MGESANFQGRFADFLSKDTTSPKNCSERLITLISTKIRIIRSIRRYRIHYFVVGCQCAKRIPPT